MLFGEYSLDSRLHLFLLDLELTDYLEMHQLELTLHLGSHTFFHLEQRGLLWESLEGLDVFGGGDGVRGGRQRFGDGVVVDEGLLFFVWENRDSVC